MKLVYTVIFITISSCIFAHDRLAIDEFNYDDYGYVIKKNGDSIFGFFNLSTILNSSKIILKIPDQKQIKIPAKEVTYIVSGSFVFKNFNTFDFLGRIIDTTGTVKIHEAYSHKINSFAGVDGPKGSYTTLRYSYIIKPPNSTSEVIYEKPFNAIKINNYNEQLKQIFLSDRVVIKYLKSLDKISFDDIPSVIGQINTLFK